MSINSIAQNNNIYFSLVLVNTGKRYSYSDTCKNKALVSFALTQNEAGFPPLSVPVDSKCNTHKYKHSTFSNNFNREFLWETW